MRGDTNGSTKPTARHSHRGHAKGTIWKKDLVYMKKFGASTHGES